MSVIWSFLAPLLYIIGLTGTFIYLFKKRFNFQFLLPVAIIAATLFVFFFAMLFHRISWGIILTVIAAVSFIPLVILDKNRKDTLQKLFFTPGLMLFIIIYTFLFAFHYDTIQQLFSDDNMHWVPHVWTMWLRDDFYTSPNLSIVTHGDYQPILQLFQLMFTGVTGAFKEGLLFIALEITCLSMVFPVLKNLSWRKAKNMKVLLFSGLILFTIVALPTTLDVTHLFYNALHPDYAIAFVFVLGAYLAFTESHKFNWTSAVILSLVVTFLCLTKQSSVLFGGLVGLIYIAGLLNSYRPKAKALWHDTLEYVSHWRKNWLSIVGVLILLALPLLALKLWSAQAKGFQSPYCCVAIFHISPSDVLKVPGVLLKQAGSESQQEYARDFFHYILTYQAGFTTHILSNVSYIQFILLFVAAMVYIGYNYKDKFRRSKFSTAAIIVVVGFFLYCFAIYLTFLFGGMIDSERENLLTGDRYLRTYVFSMLLILVVIALDFAITKFNQTRKTSKALAVYSMVALVIVGTLFNVDIVKNRYVIESLGFSTEYHTAGIANIDEFSERMRKFTQSIGGSFEHPKTIATTAKPNTQTSYYLRYLAIPNKINNGSVLEIDKHTKQDKLCDALSKNEFLFISYTYKDERSVSMINDCLSNDVSAFNQYDAYKVEKDGDKLRLVKLGY